MIPHINVSPLTYQSGDINFSQWVSLCTLCLAPLIAHIIAGAPEPTYLCRRRPRWHDRMCIYSPLSILWRYAAITDRRIRALNWSPSDLAAANAIFWTSSGWDGSEEMAARSVQYCVRLPKRTRMTLLSSDSIKTIIISLQGVQAIFVSGVSTMQDAEGAVAQYHSAVSVANVFSSLALMGLLRLLATFWITDDFSYVATEDVPLGMSRAWAISSDSLEIVPSRDMVPGSKSMERRFHPTSWQSRLFRLVYIVLFAIPCLAGLVAILLMRDQDTLQLSATGALGIATLAVVPALVVSVYVYYAIRQGCKSTIVPCIDKTWYKVATALVNLTWLALLVISAIETRRLPCGRYTTSPAKWEDDAHLCPGLVYLQPHSHTGPFGLVAEVPAANSSNSAGDARFIVWDFTGSCQGVSGESDLVQRVIS